MSSKKYHINVEQTDGRWTAQIVRQVSKQKTHISKQRDGFENQADAQLWANKALADFVNTQKLANVRQAEQRKESDEIKRQRSARRARKTAAERLNKDTSENVSFNT